MPIKIIPQRCPQDHICPAAQACPKGALTQDGLQAPVLHEKDCVDCGLCAEVCPKGAIVKS